MKELRIKFSHDEKIYRNLSNLTIRLDPESHKCVICGQKTNLLKTSGKTCYSFYFGKFVLIEGFLFCKDHKYAAINSNKVLKYHSHLATEIVDKGYKVTFDLLVKIGTLRYSDHRQLEEIQVFLKCSSSRIDLPISTIGMISKRFLEFCKLFHKKYEYKIKEDIKCNGGFILNFDGTTEKQ